jgi:hypothetical protein
VDVNPWFCSRTCPAIIGPYEVYVDSAHITNTYARVLEGVLTDALRLPRLQPLKGAEPDLHTSMVRPADRAVIAGDQPLAARATDNVPVTKVEFQLTNGTSVRTLSAKKTLYGWIVVWKTAQAKMAATYCDPSPTTPPTRPRVVNPLRSLSTTD